MTRTTAVRLGIPIRVLARRILIPVGVAIVAVVTVLSAWQFERVKARVYQEQRSALRTVFEFAPSVHNGSNGLATMARNRGFERIWVLSATGDILESNQRQEIGTRLESRWWMLLKDLPSGLHQETTRFGNQDLELLSLNSVELGRQVVIVSRRAPIGPILLMNVGFILAAGLVLWMIVAGAVIMNLRGRIERPSYNLDGQALELIRGGSLSDVQLDRIHAEIVDSLGGHADCMIDLARRVQRQGHSLQQTSSRYSVLFNALPSPAFLLDDARRVIDANEALSDAMGIDTSWLRGRDLSVLSEWIPTARLHRWLDKTATTPVGVRRMPTSAHDPDGEGREKPFLITIAPIPSSAGRGHLILVEEWNALSTRDAIPEEEAAAETETGPPSGSGPSSMPSETARVAHAVPVSGDGHVGAPPEAITSRFEDELNETLSEKEAAEASKSGKTPVDIPDQTAANSPDATLADTIMQAAGVVAIAFDENAETIFWSRGGELLTGLEQKDIPDLKQFTDRVFPHDRERKLFKGWLDSEPEDRSQELKIRSRAGIIPSVWRAGEWLDDRRGEVGVLWTHVSPSNLKVVDSRSKDRSVSANSGVTAGKDPVKDRDIATEGDVSGNSTGEPAMPSSDSPSQSSG